MPKPVPFTLPARPLLLAALIALAAGQAAQAEAPPPMPRTIGGQPVVELAAGTNHSCARVQNGQVWCWGENEYGQMGNGATAPQQLTPVQVAGLTRAVAIAAGDRHSCALRSTGRVFCWGHNQSGQLGDGSSLTRLTPVAVAGLTDVTAIAAGRNHSCALRSNGRVFCWGGNAYGQLGNGTFQFSLTPVRVLGPYSSGATGIAAGDDFACLLRQTGRVACWGRNDRFQLGDGTFTPRTLPVLVQGLTSVQQIDAGPYHGCALRSGGRVFCWGFNGNGQLGDGTLTSRATPVRVRDLSEIMQVSAGGVFGHSCAVRSTGRVFCWGANISGALGDGTTTRRLTPVRVLGLGDARQVTTGGTHSCGLRTDGRAFCWGDNFDGQLGDGTRTNRLTPVRVAN